MKQSQEQFDKRCPTWQQELKYYDKQYIGFINEAGERIIYIQLCDFRQDPYKLKPIFNSIKLTRIRKNLSSDIRKVFKRKNESLRLSSTSLR